MNNLSATRGRGAGASGQVTRTAPLGGRDNHFIAGAGVDGAAAAFTTTTGDDIIFVSSGTLRGEGHFQNVARTRRRGLEASVGYDAANRLSITAAYTWQRATFGVPLRIASRFHPGADRAEIAVTRGGA